MTETKKPTRTRRRRVTKKPETEEVVVESVRATEAEDTLVINVAEKADATPEKIVIETEVIAPVDRPEEEHTTGVVDAVGLPLQNMNPLKNMTTQEEFDPEFIREKYEMGMRFVVTGRFLYTGRWVMPGTVYEVDNVLDKGDRARMVIVRGSGPMYIVQGSDQRFINKI